jgi:hypothetical protein
MEPTSVQNVDTLPKTHRAIVKAVDFKTETSALSGNVAGAEPVLDVRGVQTSVH